MAAADTVSKPESTPPPAYLVLDTESIPDGKLIQMVKYPGETLSPEEAIGRAQTEARERSTAGSDFLPVTFQIPIAVCVARVAADFRLQTVTCLDAPEYRTREIVELFWRGIGHYGRAKLVTFNGRGFDLPLMEMAAFRYGLAGRDYYNSSRKRFNGHLDLLEFLGNYGASRMVGGLNLLSKILGKPGKMEMAGDQVYAMHRQGKIKEINDYCMFDTLDTYFVFLRTRVMCGELSLADEAERVTAAKAWIAAKAAEIPALQQYLDNWGDWNPWP